MKKPCPWDRTYRIPNGDYLPDFTVDAWSLYRHYLHSIEWIARTLDVSRRHVNLAVDRVEFLVNSGAFDDV